jgi:hypothetical protein
MKILEIRYAAPFDFYEIQKFNFRFSRLWICHSEVIPNLFWNLLLYQKRDKFIHLCKLAKSNWSRLLSDFLNGIHFSKTVI